MAHFRGPNLPKENLVLALDAGSTRSYPGTGADWFDLSPNKLTFSSSGTQTPLTTIDGVDCFQFNGSGYWTSDSGHENVDCGGDMTLLFWIHPTDLTERDTIFEKAGYPGYTSYQTEIAVTYETSENFSWYSRHSGNYDHGNTTGMTQNAWNLMGIKMSTGWTSAARTGFYSKNGQPWVSSYNSRSTNPIAGPAGEVRIGTGYAGTVESGYLASLYVYEKMLSDEEIAQFYNATRTRYGL